MKKTIFAAVVLLAMSASVQAQLVKIGIKGGLNYANQNGSDITINSTNYQTSAITSYHAGLVAEIKLVDSFSIQPELLYSTQGATYKNAVEEFQNELGYLSIPVMAKIYLNKVVSLELGPQASFLLSERNNFDVKDASTFDFAANAGLGFKITKSFFLEGRYSLGLTDASKDAQVKNSVVQVSAGFLF
ncbi:Outer membrane protein beta-barrel domain-containing protein [Flavobacterium gillisiae]|uniref:Outer membrane protein beta-barrel domain-containing protein n=1 Tax=Flavobacterium gillisiae TaxID=150146 RepID=A0A1H4FFL2_9FLAO|nr:porin family protein [Flavobacterium gillisiae]SEA95252.1 Outer membrane protein beta-barrel domain-containing protein [Flavobacterium gillisiae]